MAKRIITRRDIAQEDLLLEIKQGATEAFDLVQKLREALVTLGTGERVGLKTNAFGNPEEIRALTDALEKVKRLQADNNRLKQFETELNSLLKKSYKELTEEQKNLIRNNELIKVGTQALRQEAKQEAILVAENVDAYKKLSTQYDIAQRAAKNLAVSKGLENAETIEAINNANKYGTQLKKIDAELGQHFRNVGNYASAYNGLGNAINQITRESPAFINSMQTGFMAISNNLPILIDQIGQLKTKNLELAASGKPTVSVVGQIASAFFSWNTLFSASITLLTLYGPKILDYITGTKEANKTTIDWTSSLEGNKTAIENLLNTLKIKTIDLRLARGEINKEEAATLKLQANAAEEKKKYGDELIAQEKDLKKKLAEVRGEKEVDPATIDVQQALYDQRKLNWMGKGFKEYFDALYQARRDYNQKVIILELNTNADLDKAKIDSKDSETKSGREEKIKTMEEINKEEFTHEMNLLKANEAERIIEVEKQYIAGKLSEKQYQDALFKIKQESLQIQINLERVYRQDASDASAKFYENELKKFQDYQAKQQKVLDDAQKYNDDLDRIAAQSAINKENLKEELRKKRINDEKAALDEISKMANSYFAREQLQEQQKIDNARQRQQELALLAQKWVENASDNYAFEQKKQAEAQEAQLKLKRQQERTELAIGAFKAYAANDGNLQKTVQDLAALSAAVSNIEVFYEGTEDTGPGGNYDSKGGRPAIIHPNERIIPAKHNKRIPKWMSNDVAANILEQFNYISPSEVTVPKEIVSDKMVVKKLEEINETIRNNRAPSYRLNYNAIKKALIEELESEGLIETNIIKVGGIWGPKN